MTQPELYISIVMASISFLEIWALLYYAIVEENMKMGSKVTFKTIFTPFTALLFVIIIANVGEYSVQAMLFAEDSKSIFPTDILKTIRSCCDCAGEYCYVVYSLLRADAIVKIVLPKIQPALKVIRRFVVPVAFLAQAGTRVVAIALASEPDKVEKIVLMSPLRSTACWLYLSMQFV
ncbi:hypothetical protein BCR33DRAFT_746023 [Rhizoclosmatium globosum]|uniref:Uncharacterized protein n=1 Tax=Rhizoclosmatium globosum TaxID=329046 RepID=A0A1Y2AYN1_9FUNG|nr:hypothetical protein BCR33DRAFT_746023 [Rhizoclosmatium globosum]|eukprot:ORY27596.1 hypothetical protein BCR33DRAFT_746023 [Rhizoclosmatium globosum]